jgi:APA family basic amino acid/polyamine antiporter
VGFGAYLAAFLPAASDQNWLVGPLHLPGWKILGVQLGPYAMGLTGARLAAILLILAFTAANCLGVRLGARIQNLFTGVKLGSLAALVLLGLFLSPAAPVDPAPFVPTAPALPFFAALMVVQTGCLFSAVGWEYITNIAAEVVAPARTIPRALLIGVLLVCGLYLLVNAVYLKVLGPAAIATAPDDRVGSAALQALLGPVGGRLMAGAILVSMAGWMNGAVLSTSRIYQAMAEDGLFLKGAASLNAKGVPAAAMAAQALWACLLALTGTFGQLLEYSIFAGLLWYLVVVSAVIVARVRRPDLPRPYRVPLYPVLPLLYIAGALAILAMLLVHRPAFTWPGLLIVACGVPVYWLRRSG